MRPIDADKVYNQYIEQMKELVNSTTCENVSLETLSLLCGAKLLTDAPTIEPKRGRWIQGETPEAFNIAGVKTWELETKCSECGFVYFSAIEARVCYGWCPNCGAKMGEDEAPTYEINDKKCSNCIYGYCNETWDYATCIKPYAGFSNTHKKDWFCADWKERNNVNG